MKTTRCINNNFKFPVGYEKSHKKQLFNFQLNRPYSYGYARKEEVGSRIKSFSSLNKEMLKLAEKAICEKREINAAFYFRVAEFYIKSNDPGKSTIYNKFIELFYKVFENDDIEKHQVAYDDAFLYALKIPPSIEKKGTIVLHGGFDSFIEEFYSIVKYFSNAGYELISFEGPGQGAFPRKHGIPITYKWEKPTKAILDYFDRNDVTLIGISMGGWLSIRASAFEHRIKRAIANKHAINYIKNMPPLLRKIHYWCLEHGYNFMNRMAIMKFEKREGIASWMVDHLKYITKRTQPLGALGFYLDLNEHTIHSELVKQDVLILSGAKNHLIPAKMHAKQMKALLNAKSVSHKVFTESKNAQYHYQTGNIKPVIDHMIDWTEKLKVL